MPSQKERKLKNAICEICGCEYYVCPKRFCLFQRMFKKIKICLYERKRKSSIWIKRKIKF